ncbi:HNH endonuclease family protein [Gordonia sihwensis]|uniref:HNH endonuclease family protein n=1 Tax=Gordonia sihwensis TaxID=173559 RepID=UPI003D9A08F6
MIKRTLKRHSRRYLRKLRALVVAAIIAAAVGAWYQYDRQPAAPAPADAIERIHSALDTLESLPVRPAELGSDYDRTRDFGPRWTDNNATRLGHNGCRTDDDVIREQVLDAVMEDRCTVVSGTVNDPYSGQSYPFERSAVQVDHVVALKAIWTTGGRYLSSSERRDIANDEHNLIVVNASDNMSKGNKDFSQWRPSNAAYVCIYGANQIEVKSRYNLWVTPDEEAALRDHLTDCLGAS